MSDTYKNYKELSQNEVENKDYKITINDVNSNTTCIAIHGGNIEPATSEIVEAIAKDDYNLYKFEGIKPGRNATLHITSSHFDEEAALNLVTKSEKIISVHGAKGGEAVTYIGGRDKILGEKVKDELIKNGFKVEKPRPGIDGMTENNIANRGTTKGGCQLEITLEQRRVLFENRDLKTPRINKTKLFDKYVDCIRRALEK